MKIRILILVLFIANYSFSQAVNHYKAVIIPLKYDFLEAENEFMLQTHTKINLIDAGFQTFNSDETLPTEFNSRCELLYVDVKRENDSLVRKLYVVLKDCFDTIIFHSEVGESKEKDFKIAYPEALRGAFASLISLNYKYIGSINSSEVKEIVSVPVENSIKPESKPLLMFYAKSTPFGYKLFDNDLKEVFNIYKTSSSDSYIGKGKDIQGILVSKDNQWFFEYYQKDTLISEKIEIKF